MAHLSYVAVDIGASNLRVAYGDEGGLKERLLERTNDKNGPNGVSSQIIRMIDELEVENILSIGIGSIGPIELKTGSIVKPPNFPLKRIPIVDPLSQAFRVPLRMLNDCAAAVLGENIFGAGLGLENIIYVTLSTGLGGGVIVDGHLLLGKEGNAAEVGHLVVDPDSELVCGCGCKGHWEAYCAGINIPKYARLLMNDLTIKDSLILNLVGGDIEHLTTEILFHAASQGDPAATRIVRKIGRINAVGFANLVNLYDPDLITVGGSIAINNPDLVLNPILQEIDHYLINRKPEIMITPLGDDAVLLGALAMAIKLVYD